MPWRRLRHVTDLPSHRLMPRQTRGPFYPTALPDFHDNDLVRVTGENARALGTVAHVSGRVFGQGSEP